MPFTTLFTVLPLGMYMPIVMAMDYEDTDGGSNMLQEFVMFGCFQIVVAVGAATMALNEKLKRLEAEKMAKKVVFAIRLALRQEGVVSSAGIIREVYDTCLHVGADATRTHLVDVDLITSHVNAHRKQEVVLLETLQAEEEAKQKAAEEEEKRRAKEEERAVCACMRACVCGILTRYQLPSPPFQAKRKAKEAEIAARNQAKLEERAAKQESLRQATLAKQASNGREHQAHRGITVVDDGAGESRKRKFDCLCLLGGRPGEEGEKKEGEKQADSGAEVGAGAEVEASRRHGKAAAKGAGGKGKTSKQKKHPRRREPKSPSSPRWIKFATPKGRPKKKMKRGATQMWMKLKTESQIGTPKASPAHVWSLSKRVREVSPPPPPPTLSPPPLSPSVWAPPLPPPSVWAPPLPPPVVWAPPLPPSVV